MTDYSTRDVADLMDLSVHQVRSYVRAGLLAPERDGSGALRFSFQDIAFLRTAKALMAASIPPRRVRKALRQLRAQLPDGVPLSAVSIDIDGGRIVARDEATVWHPESGQMLFNFSGLPPDVEPMEERRAERLRKAWAKMDAEHWFELAAELEGVNQTEALEAYGRTIELDPTHADAHVNLGRLLHDQGRVREAAQHYRDALEARPEHPIAAFNFGLALEDLGRPAEAVVAYRQALASQPEYADAHFNLARVYERLGQPAAALRHMSTYKRLVDDNV